MRLEMWLWKNLPSVRTCNGHEWAVVRVCADGKRAKFSHRRLRNGIRGRTLDCDQSEILAQQTGRTHVTPRVVAARQICWPVSARVGIVSADQAECALMKLIVASLTTLRYISAS